MNENFLNNLTATSSTRTLLKMGSHRGNSRRASGFTLIEVLIALAIFAVLLVIIFVPLTQATRYLAIGRTRASLQQSANGTIAQMQRDLSRAIYVYPNDVLPGVTDGAPYNGDEPYRDSSNTPLANTSRLDLLLPELASTGGVRYPITPARYIVTYYARRLNPTQPFNPYNNPIVLYRAQYPYMDASGDRTPFQDEVDTSSTRYTGAGLEWLTMNADSEFDQLQDLCDNATSGGGLVPGNHSLVTPATVQLFVPMSATNVPINGLKPNTTFNCADTNGDGKIDRVNINLTLMNFNIANRNDSGNDRDAPILGNVNFQRFTLNQIVNLPNIR